MQPATLTRSHWLCLTLLLALPSAVPAAEDGFEPIFDGKTLEHWDGNREFWRVEDGTITGETTPEKPTKGNTFLIWRGGTPGDFELKLEYKIVGGNSGIQYRSFEVPDAKWVIGGYQADIDSGDTFSGALYGERFRGMLCPRGQKTVIQDNGKPEVVGSVGDPQKLQDEIRNEEWNEYHATAKGYTFTHKINGVTMAVCTDEDNDKRRAEGLLALQLHQGPPMKVQFRNIRLKKLGSGDATSATGGERKKIVLIAGKRSHGYGAHEHKAGCMLLAELLETSGLPVETTVVTEGWPEDTSVLNDADAIVIYADGGGGHPFNAHLDQLRPLMDKGVGLVALHYGVEVPRGDSGDAFLDWIGGYFEAHWSVNPHWTAEYDKLPRHPITRGVEPFRINDEWYYHMRFREEMEGVTPILTDLPPQESLSRPDGAHSGNPHVREAVLERKEPQHMAWAFERPNGGRGFGFTGGHWHWNWGHDEFRQLVLNAIVWSAGAEVPQGGVPAGTVTLEDLEANQDYPQPADFNRNRIQALLEEWNGDATAGR